MNKLSTYYFLVLIFGGFIVFFAFSYNPDPVQRDLYDKIENNADWLKINTELNLTVSDVTELYKHQLGLGSQDILIQHRVSEDDYGNTHRHFQHYHQNIKVEGSQLITHENNERVYLVNGTLVRNLDVNYSINVNKDDAIEKAKSYVNSSNYMWESYAAEELIKKVTKNPRATFFPSAKLVFVQASYNRDASQYELAYDVTIHTYEPEIKKQLFISAKTGELILQINDLHTGSSHGIAETRYHGTQNIITDSLAVDSFRLVDTVRKPSIITMNAMQSTAIENSVDFIDDDNYWNNFNAFQDEVATDVHFGAASTYDFYQEKLGRTGLNGDSVSMISFVHVDMNWNNATWNGFFARFGDGASPNSPLTALDVVGHEFTHGLTDFTADLVYMNEPGGLNESFSDIFGTSVEFFADPATADWRIGEDFIAGGGFRSMDNPKTFTDPDTYYGQFWAFGTGDNGGVHTNSGVQNYWFYLVADGDEGVNDNGDTYEITGLGIDIAAKIAYDNLNNYLTVNSQYIDARIGAIQATIDQFGDCTKPVSTITDAWYAAGVGEKFPRNDFEILAITSPDVEVCGVSSEELVSIMVRYNDCNGSVSQGAIIPVSYTIAGGSSVLDTIFAETEINPGDTIYFTFETPVIDFSSPGNYELIVSVDFEGDNKMFNNSTRQKYERIFAQNTDLTLPEVISPISSCFMGNEVVALQIQFKGCDSIAGGTEIDFEYRVDDGTWINNTYTLDSTLYRNDYIVAEFPDSLNFETLGVYDFDARVMFDSDTIEFNNLNENNIIDNPDSLRFRVVMTFDGIGTSSLDSFFIDEAVNSSIFVSDTAGRNDTKGLQITGNDGLNEIALNEIPEPEFANVWSNFPEYTSRTCFCADLTETDEARLKFRLTQTYSPIYEDVLGQEFRYASAARLLLNGEQFGSTYTVNSGQGSPYFLRNLDISEFAGGNLEVCFQTMVLTSKDNDPYGLGDNVYIDEVVIIADKVVNTKETIVENAVSIYPNPANNAITISHRFSDNVDIEIYDIQGRLLKQRRSVNSNSIQIPINDLHAGMFIVKVKTENKAGTTKFVKE